MKRLDWVLSTGTLLILALTGLMLAGCNDVWMNTAYSVLLAIIGVALLVVGCVLIWQGVHSEHKSGNER